MVVVLEVRLIAGVAGSAYGRRQLGSNTGLAQTRASCEARPGMACPTTSSTASMSGSP
jgi:hypothetical protein